MLVHPTSKKGSQYFLRAQTHATHVANKLFCVLFWVLVGNLVFVKVFLGVFVVCLCVVLVGVCCLLRLCRVVVFGFLKQNIAHWLFGLCVVFIIFLGLLWVEFWLCRLSQAIQR